MTSLPSTTTTHIPAPLRPDGLARPAAGTAPSGLSLSQIASMLLRHIWLITAVFAATMLITVALYAACLHYGREYTAIGRMQLSEEGHVPGDPFGREMGSFYVTAGQKQQAWRVVSPSTIDGLLALPDAKKFKYLEEHAKDPNPAEILKKKAKADPVPNTLLIQVQVADRNRVAAAEVCNKLMEYYVTLTRSEALSQTTDDRKVLEHARDNAQFILNRINGSLDDLHKTKDYESLTRARSEIIERVAQLSSDETNSLLMVEQARRQLATAKQASNDPDAPWTPEQLKSVDDNPDIINFMARRRALLEERERLEKRGILQNHPDMVEILTRLDVVETNMRNKRNELLAGQRDNAVHNAEAALAAQKNNLEIIQGQLDQAKQRKYDLGQNWDKEKGWEDEKGRQERQIDDLNAKIRKIDDQITLAMPKVSKFADASAPEWYEVSFPRWELFAAGGIFLGLFLSFGLALLIELIDTSVRTPRDISEHVRLPLLGFVPLAEEADLPREKLCRWVADQPASLLAESFRQIRTNLLFTAPADQLHSIVVTSAARDEGKTTVATNLAITVALSGRRVLLVDANFRRPALAAVFNLASPVGLSNLLTNQATLAAAVQPSGIPNLSMVPTGPTPPNPAELMGSATMRTFLDQADAEYDLVIFDGPPALLVSDVLVLATMVDGVLAVVRAGATSRGMVARLREHIAKVNGHIVGAVLNAARPTRGGYFRQSQQQYEDYHNLSA